MNTKIKLSKTELLATRMDELPLPKKVVRKLYYPYLDAKGHTLSYRKFTPETDESDIPTLEEFFALNSVIVPTNRIGLKTMKNSTQRPLKVDSQSFKELIKMLLKHGFTPADSAIMLASKKFFHKWNLMSVEQLKKMSLPQVGGLKLGTTTFAVIEAFITQKEQYWELKNDSSDDHIEQMLSIPVSEVLSWNRQMIQSMLNKYTRLDSSERNSLLLSIRKLQIRLRKLGFTAHDGSFMKLPVPKKSYTYAVREEALLWILDTLLPLAEEKLTEEAYNIVELILTYEYTYREAAHFLGITEAKVKKIFDKAVVAVVSTIK